MKPYSNKSDRTDSRKCLFSEIKKGDKARKKAKRKEGKNSIAIAIENNMAFDNETEI